MEHAAMIRLEELKAYQRTRSSRPAGADPAADEAGWRRPAETPAAGEPPASESGPENPRAA
jgi:hypothetical protein